MTIPLQIKNRIIGKGYPTFIIAEMACAHQGDVKKACELVKVAVKAQADAIQLQLFKKEIYMSPISKSYDLITKLELSQEEWLRVIKLIKKENILFFSAGYDIESIKFLRDNEVDAFKVHSSDTSNPEVLKEVAKSGKPIFLSCGASTITEIEKTIKILRENGTKDIVLMHGYQAFPTKIEDTHLNFIRTLEETFDLNVGFYDHVDGSSILAKIIPIMAIGYGTQVIEKHFILSRKEKGIDYESSLEPVDLSHFIELLRKSEKAIGSKDIRGFTEDELKYRENCKKSIVAMIDIKEGEIITKDKIMFLRNEPGIPPVNFNQIEGKIAKKAIKKYHNLNFDDF